MRKHSGALRSLQALAVGMFSVIVTQLLFAGWDDFDGAPATTVRYVEEDDVHQELRKLRQTVLRTSARNEVFATSAPFSPEADR
jgi:hypothetical protein